MSVCLPVHRSSSRVLARASMEGGGGDVADDPVGQRMCEACGEQMISGVHACKQCKAWLHSYIDGNSEGVARHGWPAWPQRAQARPCPQLRV